jgi:hypothetical protein
LNGTADPGFEDFERATIGRLGVLLSAPPVEVRILNGRIAAWTDVSTQSQVIEEVVSWLASLRDRIMARANIGLGDA